MDSTYSFCAVVEAFVCLSMLFDFSDCRHMEKRNALLIVGNTFYVPKKFWKYIYCKD